ncbi:MAG: lysoplasmalogenase family protein [Candidatus Bathyarchaeota archaeon]|nr:lysoplasmalogenase family protein [Candidatus Bathyarchaeota archaeon]
MTNTSKERIVSIIRIIVIVILLAIVGVFSVTYILYGGADQLYIRLSSTLLVVLAALNLLSARFRQDYKWMAYSLLFAVAMLFGSIGDFMMAELLYLTPDAFINAVIFFGIGNLFYILGLGVISPLLTQRPTIEISAPDRPGLQLIPRNLILFLLVAAATAAVYIFTAVNPLDPFLGLAALSCAFLLASAVAFAWSKFFEEFPLLFKLVIALGFPIFLFSSWVMGVRSLASSDFLDSFIVGITYVIGLLLIHLSPALAADPDS